MKQQFVKGLILWGVLVTMLCGCGGKNTETTEATESDTTISAEDESETKAEKAQVDFEKMHYNAFLKNAAGEDVVGYHIPFTWEQWDVNFNDSTWKSLNGWSESGNQMQILIMYGEDYKKEKGDIYSNLPDSYLVAKEKDTSRHEEYDSYELEYIGETECPYGTAYLFAENITGPVISRGADGTEEEHQDSYSDLEAVIPWGNDVILLSTINSPEFRLQKSNESRIKEMLAVAFDVGEEIKEIPKEYEYYLTSNRGENAEKILGYHLPEGWTEEYNSDTWHEFQSGPERVKIKWAPYDAPLYLYKKLYTEGINIDQELNDFHNGGAVDEYRIEIETEFKDEVETVYGTVKIYDRLETSYYEGRKSTDRYELGILIWNGLVFSIEYSDNNTDGYQGRLKELLGEIF